MEYQNRMKRLREFLGLFNNLKYEDKRAAQQLIEEAMIREEIYRELEYGKD